MDVINKLRNTVSSVSNSLSTVLPGNPVTREYEIIRHIASAGPGLLWKVFQGIKKSTKEEAAIFVLQKSQLDRFSKRDRELILDVLKKGVSQLTRLRHPAILTVQHPLEESRESLAFATEPVFASLANILNHHDNMPTPPPPELKGFSLHDVEIKYGLLQLSEGLAFLHNDVKLLHRNISPESILINGSGAWRISGFEFCVPNSSQPDQAPFFEYKEWNQELPPVTQPNLDYLAPEYGLTMACGPASDMFSLGCVIYSLYNKGSTFHSNCGTWSIYKDNSDSLRHLTVRKLQSLPEGIKDHNKMLLNLTAELRPDALQFTKIPFFEDVGVKTLQYLDSLFQWDNLQKSHFYRGLPQVLKTLPKRVSLHRILPCLVKEFVNSEMIPFVLPNVLFIAEQASKEEFLKHILPDLIPILLIFMQQMELLLTKCTPNDIKNHILPMIYRSLESDAQQIQELSLHIIPNFAHLVDFPSIKNSLLPRIKKLCIGTNYLSVRVNCLVCLGQLLEHLDKWVIMDNIFPALQEIPSKEPAVLMGIVGIYKMTLAHKKLGITKDEIASKIIPFLMPLSIENGLTLNQFNSIIGLIKELINKVETEHKAKLEQLNSIQQEQRHTLDMTQKAPSDFFQNFEKSKQSEKSMNCIFKDLGLDNYMDQDIQSQTKSAQESMISSPQQSQVVKSTLSMEDKEKLMKEQELKLRFQSQQPLNPQSSDKNKSVMSPNKPTAPKDLTSTLINSNLASMSLSSNQPMNQPMNSMNPVTPFNNQMYSSQGMMGGGCFPSQPIPAFGGNFTSQPSNITTTPRGSQMQSMKNMSSLDNLLVTSS
ncbi:SCY1-like protein 2 [Nymphon striatum]|nr:SCY1-like protein 2 [Nymphon striatum]